MRAHAKLLRRFLTKSFACAAFRPNIGALLAPAACPDAWVFTKSRKNRVTRSPIALKSACESRSWSHGDMLCFTASTRQKRVGASRSKTFSPCRAASVNAAGRGSSTSAGPLILKTFAPKRGDLTMRVASCHYQKTEICRTIMDDGVARCEILLQPGVSRCGAIQPMPEPPAMQLHFR